MGVDSGGLNALLLLLLLDGIGSVGLGLLGVGSDLQLCLLDLQFIVLLGDLGVGHDAGLVGGLVGFRLGNGHVTVSLGLGDGRVLLDEGGVVGTQVTDQAVLVCDILDVAGQDLDAQLIHVLGRFLHHLIGEGVTVGVDFFQRQCADDLTHVALERVLQVHGDVGCLLVQEVLGCQLDALLGGGNTDLGNSVHIDVDEVVGRHGLLRLDVHRHLAQIQLIQTLKEGDADTGPANQDLTFFFQAGDDVRLIGRCFHITHQEQHNDNYRNDDRRDQLQDELHNFLHFVLVFVLFPFRSAAFIRSTFGIVFGQTNGLLNFRAGHIPVKCRPGGLLVRPQEQKAGTQGDAEGDGPEQSIRIGAAAQNASSQRKYHHDHGKAAQQAPANKTEIQAEQPPLVSIHHMPGLRNGLAGGHLRMLRQYVRRHGVTERFNDARDDEQQCPEDDVEACQEIHAESRSQAVKLGEQVGEHSLLVIHQVQIEFRVAQLTGSADNNLDDAPDNHQNEKCNDHWFDLMPKRTLEEVIQFSPG